VASGEARRDWEQRSGRRSDASTIEVEAPPPPARVEAEGGAGQVTLRWKPVDGAIGYVVHRARRPEGPWEPVDHGGRDVIAGPGPWYCDTTGKRSFPAWYAVASIAAVERDPGELSQPVQATPLGRAAGPVVARVSLEDAGRIEPVWHMLGSEHLSQLLYPNIGPDFEQALRLARAELGAETVRAHAILHDENAVVREDGSFDLARVLEIYERVLALGLRPIVELGFMPAALARNPNETVFEYRAIISPPRDWDRWGELCGALARACVERFGIDEVARWGFEVWNEANLEVFWSGTKEEYLRLYDVAARAVKAVDERLRVGGPATAAAGWVADFLDFVREEESPFDFFSTHTYGNLPLDVRRALEARGLPGEVWWTEWGATPTHFFQASDAAWGAPYVLHGMKSVQGRADALAYWVVSDHFEELGRPPRFLHGGFGLLTVGNVRKPRFWALRLAEELGRDLVRLDLSGDGAGSLVDGWATRGGDGTVQLLLWNATLDQSKVAGDPLLARHVRLDVEGGPYRATVARIDRDHASVADRYRGGDWPTEEEWAELREADRLEEEPLDGLELDLPMPGVARIRLEPVG
jgi:xylan 1,4-beta-xylosidase